MTTKEDKKNQIKLFLKWSHLVPIGKRNDIFTWTASKEYFELYKKYLESDHTSPFLFAKECKMKRSVAELRVKYMKNFFKKIEQAEIDEDKRQKNEMLKLAKGIHDGIDKKNTNKDNEE